MFSVRVVLSSALAVLLFLFSVNAYACLVPVYGGAHAMEGSGCMQPGEEPAKQFCDHFKTLTVQSTQDVDPVSGPDLAAGWELTVPATVLAEGAQPVSLTSINPHAPPPDILICISVFRI